MKDPVNELFESMERKPDVSDHLPDPFKPVKRVCVVFHGASFTGTPFVHMHILAIYESNSILSSMVYFIAKPNLHY